MHVVLSHCVSGNLLCSNRNLIHMVYDKDNRSALSTASGTGASDAHGPEAELTMNRDTHTLHSLVSGIVT